MQLNYEDLLNNNKVWNDQGATLNIIVHPPFYLTVPFKIIYFMLFCAAIAAIVYFFYKRKEKNHAVEIERINNAKDKEIHRAKITFFTMIAHEIRTPVSLITGPLEKIMLLSSDLPQVIRKDIEMINRNSQRLIFLVNQLLDFRKIEEEKMKMEFHPQLIDELVRSVCDRFRLSIEQKGIAFYVKRTENDFRADIDKEGIIKVLSNLLSNATKYTRNKIEVACNIQLTQQTFTISVKDNGEGIHETELKNIFKPFYQVSENNPGTGMGLSIANGIVESHNGFIEVNSEPGKGTEFLVILPLEQSHKTERVYQEKEYRPSPEDILPNPTLSEEIAQKPSLLLVDDNEEMLQFLSDNLQINYTIYTARNGVQAWECLKKQEINLIVSDWMMPEMDGEQFCRKVRANELTSHIPFILLTAKTDTYAKVSGMDCGADAYIEKPFSMPYLEACIKNLINLRKQLSKKYSQTPGISPSAIAVNTTDEVFLKRMTLIIEENFSNPDLSVDFIADHCCPVKLFRLIKIRLNPFV